MNDASTVPMPCDGDAPPLPAGASNMGAPDHLRLIAASQITPRRQSWVWQDRVPLGGLTIFGGIGGVGKSTFALHLAALASRGELDGDLLGQPVGTVVSCSEDDKASVVVPRLIAAGADLDLVHFVGVPFLQDDPEYDAPPTLPLEVARLGEVVQNVGARLIVLDPIMTHLDAMLSANSEQDVREALQPLVRMLRRTGASCIGIHHLNKRVGASSSRLTGSTAFRNVARSVLMFAVDPDETPGDEPPMVLVMHEKSNAGSQQRPVGFRLEDATAGADADGLAIATARVDLLGEVDDVDQERVIAGERQQQSSPSSRAEAVEFLKVELADGQVATKELKRRAKDADLSWRTVERAKDAAGARAKRVSGADGAGPHWVWTMNNDEPGHDQVDPGDES